MSSNNHKPNHRSWKKNSTAYDLHRMWIGKLFYILLTIDIALAGCGIGALVYYSELIEYGSFQWSYIPTIILSRQQLNIIGTCSLILLSVEAILLLGNFIFGIYAVRRKLKPLDDMAAMAGKLGAQAKNLAYSFDEKKMHSLEDAISKITTDGPEGKLHTNDSELKGLEKAINELLERMRAAYQQQTQFVSDASHELRTPIAVIQGYVNMLDRWGKEDEQILEESIEAIKHESDHMKKLVEQLLFLARGDSGRNQFRLESVDLVKLVSELYEESLMIDEQHVYRFKTEQEAIMILADPAMLKQAARVLVDNAAKYTNEHERITIGCGMKDADSAYLYVQDNGTGMEHEDVAHMFERFYRADAARESKKSGMGLGLSIAQWIVGRHYGAFEVKTMKDIGTRITILLPQEPVRREHSYVDGT